jgi:hypothetical protein
MHVFQVIIRSRAMVKLRSLANLVTEWKDKRYTSAISGNYVSPLNEGRHIVLV